MPAARTGAYWTEERLVTAMAAETGNVREVFMSIAKLMAGAAGVAVLAAAAATLAQPAKTLPAATTQHIAAARRIAGTDLPQTTIGELFNILRMGNLVDGSLLPVNPATAGPLGQGTYPPLGPVKVFDNLYVVGSTFVDAWILVTSDGIIQFDAMNNESDAKTIIEPAYAKLGLDPKKIKYIVLTHGHFDHFGGAPYFQKKYGVKVISSREDWDLM
jgi:metallo-beta-lactamase class B